MKAYVNDAPMMKIEDRDKEKFVIWLFCDFVALIHLKLFFERWNIVQKKEQENLYNELNIDLFCFEYCKREILLAHRKVVHNDEYLDFNKSDELLKESCWY